MGNFGYSDSGFPWRIEPTGWCFCTLRSLPQKVRNPPLFTVVKIIIAATLLLCYFSEDSVPVFAISSGSLMFLRPSFCWFLRYLQIAHLSLPHIKTRLSFPLGSASNNAHAFAQSVIAIHRGWGVRTVYPSALRCVSPSSRGLAIPISGQIVVISPEQLVLCCLSLF